MNKLPTAFPDSEISPALPSDLKEQNRRMVLSAFRDSQEHTAAEISALTGISKITVKRAIQFFCTNGTLISCGKGSSTELGGKKPEIFRLSSPKCLLNITVWPDSLMLTLFDIGGSILGSTGLDWKIPDTPDAAFAVIRQESDALFASAGVDRGLLFGVNFSTSGIVDYRSRTLKYNVHSPTWGSNVDIEHPLRRIFGDVPCVTVENTGKSISRAVLENQSDRMRRTLVLFSSWGLSASLIQGGRIQNGRDSLIGEVGHMIIDPNDTELCSCGSRGCLERMVNVSRLRKIAANDPPPEQSLLHGVAVDSLTLKMLFDASRLGDEYARGYVEHLAGCFAVMLRNVALSFNPEAVIFVGDYAAADGYFEKCLTDQLSVFRYLPARPFEIGYDTRELAMLDALGGAIMLREIFFEQSSLYED